MAMLIEVLFPHLTAQRTPFLELLQKWEMQVDQYESRTGEWASDPVRLAAAAGSSESNVSNGQECLADAVDGSRGMLS